MEDKIIKSVLDWNPWYGGEFPLELLGYDRDYNLSQYLEFREIKIIEGARRVGKSTLVYQVIKKVYEKSKKILYLNFDDEVLRQYSLSEVYYKFLEKSDVDYLFVDEVQNCKEWVSFVRKIYDLKEVKQIWITGSNSSLIKKEYATLLTGRNITLKINSLSFKEYLNFKNVEFNFNLLSSKKIVEIKKNFKNYIKFGSFPEVALRKVNQKELLINYYEDFLYKDIVSRYNVNSKKLKELGLFLSSNLGSLISYRNLAKTLNLNYNTVVDYLSYFKEVYLFDEIYKYDYSLKKQISSDKKIYSIDTGISNAISFNFSQNLGRNYENLVFNELKRRKNDIYLNRDVLECDFVVKEGLNIVKAIQVTVSLEDLKTKKREIDGLLVALKKYDLDEGLILTHDEENEIFYNGKKIIIKPIWKWLLSDA